MIEFSFNNKINILLSVIMGVGLVLHIIYTTLNSEKYKKISFHAESMFLIYITILTLMPLISVFDKQDGLINVDTYNNLSYVFGLLSLVLFTLTIILEKYYSKILPIVIVLLTLPYVTDIAFGIFTFTYITSSFVIIIRSILLIGLTQKELNEKSINLLTSVGIDTLKSGILFCNENGYVYLCNKKMHEIMIELFGSVQKNGDIFWNNIVSSKILNFDKEFIGEEILLRNINKTLRFKKNNINIKTKKYYEIIVSDITKLDSSIQALKQSQKELVMQEKELLNLADKMIELVIAKEHTKFRTDLHDEFGQRLTLFQRIVGSTDPNLYENAQELLDSIENIIVKKENTLDETSFEHLVNFFKKIDVIIVLNGQYPSDDDLKELLFYSTRECTINAIKHNSSTKVFIEINDNTIIITDNGILPQEEIIEGSGLKGLRRRIEEKGATLKIESIPKLKITIKKGAKND